MFQYGGVSISDSIKDLGMKFFVISKKALLRLRIR